MNQTRLDPLNLLRFVHYRNRLAMHQKGAREGRTVRFPLPIQRVA